MKSKLITLTLFLSIILIGCGGTPSDSANEDPDNTPPSAPGGFAGISGDKHVELLWETNSESDLAGYNLYRSVQGFSDVSNMDPINGNQLLSNTNFADNELENGTTYYYRLTAVDEDDNESAASPQVEVTPFSDPPNRPKVVQEGRN